MFLTSAGAGTGGSIPAVDADVQVEASRSRPVSSHHPRASSIAASPPVPPSEPPCGGLRWLGTMSYAPLWWRRGISAACCGGRREVWSPPGRPAKLHERRRSGQPTAHDVPPQLLERALQPAQRGTRGRRAGGRRRHAAARGGARGCGGGRDRRLLADLHPLLLWGWLSRVRSSCTRRGATQRWEGRARARCAACQGLDSLRAALTWGGVG
jgi:hypothetical protein